MMSATGIDTAGLLKPATQALIESLVRGPAEVPALEARQALARMLDSAAFVKARRTSRLLQFLIEKRLANAVRDVNEFTIGIEVFERDPATFSPGEDPVVRVQVGRLREKLRLYYATLGARAEIAFSIPVGAYMPVIQRRRGDSGGFSRSHLLSIAPLTWIGKDPAGAAFTEGLCEELTQHLFHEFGDKIVSPTYSASYGPHRIDAGSGTGQEGASHVLEGSVRVDGELTRVSMRLVDARAGSIAWLQHFDRHGALAISLQEELGFAVCCALKNYFCHA